MIKFALGMILSIGGLLAYFSLPLLAIADLRLTLTNQDGREIMQDATATYFGAHNVRLATLELGWPGQAYNNLNWRWISAIADKAVVNADARLAISARIEAKGCEPLTIPVALKRSYVPLTFEPQGLSAAYFHYKFDRKIALQCR